MTIEIPTRGTPNSIANVSLRTDLLEDNSNNLATRQDELLLKVNQSFNKTVTSDALISRGDSTIVIATASIPDLTFDGGIVAGSRYKVRNSIKSTFNARILTSDYTVYAGSGPMAEGSNLVLPSGDSVELYALSDNELEVIDND